MSEPELVDSCRERPQSGARPSGGGAGPVHAPRLEGITRKWVRPGADNPSPDTGATLHLMKRAKELALLEEMGAARGLLSVSKARLPARLVELQPGDALRASVNLVV
ncbi:hypothetical protein KH5H1_09770 [Corallococcus caeni]|nr:hypothetical protein KH5H1_09770 [Corallococcus sp. KH5-1]